MPMLITQTIVAKRRLMTACTCGHKYVVEILLQHDDRIDQCSIPGDTALMIASEEGKYLL